MANLAVSDFVPGMTGGQAIERLLATPIAAEPSFTIVAGDGRSVIPGMIDYRETTCTETSM